MPAPASYREPPAPVFLFDLDGTLIDSVYQHVIAWRGALSRLDIDLSVWRSDRHRADVRRLRPRGTGAGRRLPGVRRPRRPAGPGRRTRRPRPPDTDLTTSGPRRADIIHPCPHARPPASG